LFVGSIDSFTMQTLPGVIYTLYTNRTGEKSAATLNTELLQMQTFN